jgi:hypothetical protein
VSEEFFRITATRTWNTTKSMVDHSAIQKFLTEKNLFFIFYTKVDVPVKAVIGHFPGNLSVEDITMDLQEIRVYFDVISMKQVTAKRSTSEGRITPPSPFPNSASKESRRSRNLQINDTMQHSYKGRSL